MISPFKFLLAFSCSIFLAAPIVAHAQDDFFPEDPGEEEPIDDGDDYEGDYCEVLSLNDGEQQFELSSDGSLLDDEGESVGSELYEEALSVSAGGVKYKAEFNDDGLLFSATKKSKKVSKLLTGDDRALALNHSKGHNGVYYVDADYIVYKARFTGKGKKAKLTFKEVGTVEEVECSSDEDDSDDGDLEEGETGDEEGGGDREPPPPPPPPGGLR